MSLYDYRVSQQLEADDVPFYALIMAAMRKADPENATALRIAFPQAWRELEQRYWAPGGLLAGEAAAPVAEEPPPAPEPIGYCPRCKAPWFTEQGFCGGCGG